MVSIRNRVKSAAILLAVLAGTGAEAAITYSSQHATGITGTRATLVTNVNSTSSLSYTATFDYGESATYGTNVPGAGGTFNITPFYVGPIYSVGLTGLTCATTYHFRINVAAASTDTDRTFTTGSCAAPIPTVSEWGMIFLGTALAGLIVLAIKRQGPTHFVG